MISEVVKTLIKIQPRATSLEPTNSAKKPIIETPRVAMQDEWSGGFSRLFELGSKLHVWFNISNHRHIHSPKERQSSIHQTTVIPSFKGPFSQQEKSLGLRPKAPYMNLMAACRESALRVIANAYP